MMFLLQIFIENVAVNQSLMIINHQVNVGDLSFKLTADNMSWSFDDLRWRDTFHFACQCVDVLIFMLFHWFDEDLNVFC